MQWLQSAFQGESPGLTLLLIVFGLAIALVLLFWVFRKIAGTGGPARRRSRAPRLSVVDAARIDGKRRLVLVQRDGVEHLLLIGGGSDVLVESHIAYSDEMALEPALQHDEVRTPEPALANEIGVTAAAAGAIAVAEHQASDDYAETDFSDESQTIPLPVEMSEEPTWEEPAVAEAPAPPTEDYAAPAPEPALDVAMDQEPPVDEPQISDQPPATPDDSNRQKPPLSKNADVEDEMQRLLDELSNN